MRSRRKLGSPWYASFVKTLAPELDIFEGGEQTNLGDISSVFGGIGIHGGALEKATPSGIHVEDARHTIFIQGLGVGCGMFDGLDIVERPASILGGQDVS